MAEPIDQLKGHVEAMADLALGMVSDGTRALLADDVALGQSVTARDVPLDRFDVAIETANSLPVAFQSAIYTRDLARALRAAQRLDASAVMINDHTAFRTDWMPFAGRRQSGYGIGGIPWTMREMTQEKMMVFNV